MSYEYVELDGGILGGNDDTGIGLGVGVRFRSSHKLELNAGVKHVDYGDFGDDTGLEAGALYRLNDTFSLGLRAEWSDDISMFALNGRFYFGK